MPTSLEHNGLSPLRKPLYTDGGKGIRAGAAGAVSQRHVARPRRRILWPHEREEPQGGEEPDHLVPDVVAGGALDRPPRDVLDDPRKRLGVDREPAPLGAAHKRRLVQKGRVHKRLLPVPKNSHAVAVVAAFGAQQQRRCREPLLRGAARALPQPVHIDQIRLDQIERERRRPLAQLDAEQLDHAVGVDREDPDALVRVAIRDDLDGARDPVVRLAPPHLRDLIDEARVKGVRRSRIQVRDLGAPARYDEPKPSAPRVGLRIVHQAFDQERRRDSLARPRRLIYLAVDGPAPRVCLLQ